MKCTIHHLAGGLLALAVATASATAAADLTVYDSPSGDFKLDLYGWVQPRLQIQQQDTRPAVNLTPNPAFTVQRARLGTIATIGKWAKLQFEYDLAKEVATPFDAFLIFSPVHETIATVNLQIGQFRVPFSRQNLLPSVGLQFSDLAYFVKPNFLVDRDIGAMLWGELFDGRARWSVGMFNGNDPGRGQTQNSDPYFLYAARLEGSPLGRAPRFEGDLRPIAEQKKPVVTVGVSAMKSRFDDKHVNRNYLGGDLGAWWRGASIYGEVYYHVDDPLFTTGPNATVAVKQMGWNVQAGYFLPLPWVREHVELVGRVESIDPDIGVKKPANDSGAQDLTQSNPTWGYTGFLFGANVFVLHSHLLKLQANYEVRNETKRCLEGQTGSACTGFVKNNVFVVQATAGF